MKTSARTSSTLKKEQQLKLIKIVILLLIVLIISHFSKDSLIKETIVKAQ